MSLALFHWAKAVVLYSVLCPAWQVDSLKQLKWNHTLWTHRENTLWAPLGQIPATGFDPVSSGLWAQRAAPAPCRLVFYSVLCPAWQTDRYTRIYTHYNIIHNVIYYIYILFLYTYQFLIDIIFFQKNILIKNYKTYLLFIRLSYYLLDLAIFIRLSYCL